MKKFWSVLLIAIMVVTMTGCKEEKKDPKVMFEEAMEKMEELDSVDMSANIDMTMDMEDEMIEMTVNMDVKMENMQEENMKMAAPINMKMMGVTIEGDFYYADGYYYMDMLGQKIKVAMDINELNETYTESLGINIKDLDMYKDFVMEEKDDLYVIQFVCDDEKVMEYSKNIMESMGNMYTVEWDDMGLEEMQGSITVNEEGYVVEQVMDITMSMEIEEVSTTYDMVMTTTYHNPGEDVTVELPDVSEYLEMEVTE